MVGRGRTGRLCGNRVEAPIGTHCATFHRLRRQVNHPNIGTAIGY